VSLSLGGLILPIGRLAGIYMTRLNHEGTRLLSCRNLVHRHVPRAFPRSVSPRSATLRPTGY
jgi:hypothetical protein